MLNWKKSSKNQINFVWIIQIYSFDSVYQRNIYLIQTNIFLSVSKVRENANNLIRRYSDADQRLEGDLLKLDENITPIFISHLWCKQHPWNYNQSFPSTIICQCPTDKREYNHFNRESCGAQACHMAAFLVRLLCRYQVTNLVI